MAGVRSLAVRGIRSFGPDENDEQRISFYQPLTLILGQNGCGKTTIIECLRYAITGQMPPGSRNECFVHDAKVNRTTEVLGQVKLKIVNAKDKQLEVSRTMKVTALQKKKPKFQTLDSFLSVIDENGKTKDISSRCADMDSLMFEELGVSKAILNSVIFCHQEDASWPLDEGKKVKERFDEIFDSDKYSECFDRLRKIGKEYAQSIKILEHEVAHLTEKKADLDKIKLDVVNTETSVSEAETKVTELTNELKPMAEKLSAIKVLEKNLQSIESKREKIKIKLEHNQTQEQELKKAITNLFEGTMEELQTALQTYAATVKSKQKELEESYKQNTTFNNEEMKIANEKTDNEAQFNKLILLENQNQEKIDSKYKMIVNVGKIAEIEIAEVTNEEESNKALTELALKISNMLRNVEAQRELAQEEEKKLQDLVDASRDALSRHKQKISGKENELKTLKKDIAKVEKEINSANESKTRLETMEQKMKAAEDEYRQTENELNIEECQEEINQDEKAVESHEQELNALDGKVSKLQKQSSKIKEKDMTEDSLKQTEKQLTVLKNKHRSALTELLGQMPESSFAMAVNKFECTTRNEVDSIKQKQKEKQMELTKCEAERKHVRDTLNKRRTALTKAEDQIYKACGAQSYKATLEKLTTSVEKLQEDQNVLQSSMFIFAKYKAQLKDNNCCPLCNRGFDAENEVTDLIQQLTTQVMNVPTKLEKVTEELQRTSAKKDELLSMKSVSENITTLKEEIPQLESRLAELDKGIASLTETLEELSMSVIDPEQRLQTAQRIQGDMTLLDRYTTEHKNTLKELERMKQVCSEFECDMSLDEASAKQTDLRQKASTLRARIKAAHQRINAHNKKLAKAADRKNKLKEDMLNLQKKVQEICNLQESLKSLQEKMESIIAEVKELEEGTAALETELKEKNLEKTTAVNKSRESLDEKRNNLSSLQVAFERVMSMDLEIKKHEALKTHEKMDQIKAANDKLEEKQKQIMIDRATLTKRIDTLKDEIAKQEVYKRDLDDNLNLRKAQVEIENCGKEMEEVEEKLKGLNRDSLQEKEALMTEYDKKLREKTYTGGKLSTLKDTLEKQRIELKKALKKDIETRYKEKYYELHVSKAIDKDIKQYSVALEKCVMEFHKEKMENINLIIREMWRKIYRGNDIDHIEIKTESTMTAESDRRKYDYRVVQWKNGVEIDMRGRCSAGQKVLACLIIRLALAETFSSKFGILALDEPTTNLDQENITSLCSALGEIVQDRMSQKNFMFIIITHDKEFIESLGNIDKVTHYYEVARNEHGKSRIKKIRFS